MARGIWLVSGGVALVDDEDYDRLSGTSWNATGVQQYVIGVVGGAATFMHRLIMDAQPGELIDHANGDTRDNRRVNLRRCTHRQNMQNRRPSQLPRRGPATAFKGIHGRRTKKKGIVWHVSIHVDGRSIQLGSFLDERTAAQAYDRAALEHFGEFAWLNFPTCHTGRDAG